MRAVEANHGIPSLGSSNPSFLEGGRGRKKEKSEGVSGMVHELWVRLLQDFGEDEGLQNRAEDRPVLRDSFLRRPQRRREHQI